MEKPLHLVPMRLQRLRIRLQRYNVTVQYTRGKSIPVADTLSRNGARDGNVSDEIGVDVYVHAILKQMPVSDEKLEKIRRQLKTTMNCGSPAQRLMNQRLRTDLPTHYKELFPKLADFKATRKVLEQRKLEQKRYYDCSAKALQPLDPNDSARMCQKGK